MASSGRLQASASPVAGNNGNDQSHLLNLLMQANFGAGLLDLHAMDDTELLTELDIINGGVKRDPPAEMVTFALICSFLVENSFDEDKDGGDKNVGNEKDGRNINEEGGSRNEGGSGDKDAIIESVPFDTYTKQKLKMRTYEKMFRYY
ncbi:hypothetical protein Tco_1154814 [Tanacetum coccineum]